MKWVKNDNMKVPVKSWCEDVDEQAMKQARNLANHPVIFKHVALMPDCHVGYGMPIGGVIACDDAVIPNAVGVDIGCGMAAVETDYSTVSMQQDKTLIRDILEGIREQVPLGEGHAHQTPRQWAGFDEYLDQLGIRSLDDEAENNGKLPGWFTREKWELAKRNLGTLGGGNHFIELQQSESGKLWIMLHSGSRNLGHAIASYYHKLAMELNRKWRSAIPDKDLSFLPLDSEEGQLYIRDMNFAMAYALENRKRMMACSKSAVADNIDGFQFLREVNIHHNYAALENHFGQNRWVHRKGATSAREGQIGIIPGSMGTASYIVEGLGNPESFQSCSHGAGRVLGRMQASRQLTLEECEKSMEGVVYDRWKKVKTRGKKQKKQNQGLLDFGEAPLAYKDIDSVIQAELDLIRPLVKLKPLGVLKG
jgi:tRNA-splicing ligase RtcB